MTKYKAGDIVRFKGINCKVIKTLPFERLLITYNSGDYWQRVTTQKVSMKEVRKLNKLEKALS